MPLAWTGSRRSGATRCKNAHCSRPLRLLLLHDFVEDSDSHGRLSPRNYWGCCCCKVEFPNRPRLTAPCYSDLLANSCLNESDRLSECLIRTFDEQQQQQLRVSESWLTAVALLLPLALGSSLRSNFDEGGAPRRQSEMLPRGLQDYFINVDFGQVEIPSPSPSHLDAAIGSPNSHPACLPLRGARGSTPGGFSGGRCRPRPSTRGQRSGIHSGQRLEIGMGSAKIFLMPAFRGYLANWILREGLLNR